MSAKIPSLALTACIVLASACSVDDTSPKDRALDGIWTTGHSVNGLELGLTLQWTNRSVQGTGHYTTPSEGTHCGNVAVTGEGAVIRRPELVSRSRCS
jgi:hypothetical protein